MKTQISRRVFTGTVLAAGAAASSSFLSPSAHAQQQENPLITPRIMGDPDAPVLIIEYSSLTCPHCARFHADALPKIKREYIETGKARFELRDFPLNQQAALATLMARCAPEDRYFALVDLLFAQLSTWSRSQQIVTELAKLGGFAGMSKPDLEACFQNQELYSAIQTQRVVWNELHEIRATPTVFVNDTRFEGARPFEEYAEAIEAELS